MYGKYWSVTLFTLLLFSSFLIGTVDTEIQELSYVHRMKARKWIERYIVDKHGAITIPLHDLTALNNLLYFSYARSYSTVIAQKKALPLLHNVWKGWQNVAQTRRNPSLKRPYIDFERLDTDIYTQFCDAVQEHALMGATYAQITEHIIKKSFLETTRAQEAVEQLRSLARIMTMSQLVSLRSCLEMISTYITNHSPKKSRLKSARTFLESVTRFVPQMLQKSFIQADILTYKVGDELWNMLYNLQEVSSTNWQEIEKNRAAFYYAYYQELNILCTQHKLDDTYKIILFDDNGPLEHPHAHLPAL